jgi:hypothetical protein
VEPEDARQAVLTAAEQVAAVPAHT